MGGMRPALWLALVLAGTSCAQPNLTVGVAPASPLSSFARDMLNAHNAVRARVGVPRLEWSDELAAYAQQWADTLLARNQFVHRSHLTVGENLYEIVGGSASPERVLHMWAEVQSPRYDYVANKCNGQCGHYLQVVWADTRKVGCAMAGRGGREVWACNYDPPGNWVGLRPYLYALRH